MLLKQKIDQYQFDNETTLPFLVKKKCARKLNLKKMNLKPHY